jgi:hypothetical protein
VKPSSSSSPMVMISSFIAEELEALKALKALNGTPL